MSLIRFGSGSQLYVYRTGSKYVCCDCARKQASITFDTKDELKTHILIHKEAYDSIGLVGNLLTYQSYDELLEAIDEDN